MGSHSRSQIGQATVSWSSAHLSAEALCTSWSWIYLLTLAALSSSISLERLPNSCSERGTAVALCQGLISRCITVSWTVTPMYGHAFRFSQRSSALLFHQMIVAVVQFSSSQTEIIIFISRTLLIWLKRSKRRQRNQLEISSAPYRSLQWHLIAS